MEHCKYIWLPALILVILSCTSLAAQDEHVSVAWKIAPICGANFPSDVLRQDLEDQLRAASIVISRIHTAGLVADIDCEAAAARSVLVQQCLGLSQAVAEPSAANGLHLSTTWRNCQSYVCSKQNCGWFARGTQHALIDQFILTFRALRAKSKAPDLLPATESQLAEGTSVPVVYAAIAKPILKPSAVFYMLYILTCIAVLARWQWCR